MQVVGGRAFTVRSFVPTSAWNFRPYPWIIAGIGEGRTDITWDYVLVFFVYFILAWRVRAVVFFLRLFSRGLLFPYDLLPSPMSSCGGVAGRR